MPTPPPEPVDDSVSEEEKRERKSAVDIVVRILDGFYDYSYSTRSHMPAGMDFTEFIDALNKIKQFAVERPDWTLNIIKNYTWK